jgi:hypothetical protein
MEFTAVERLPSRPARRQNDRDSRVVLGGSRPASGPALRNAALAGAVEALPKLVSFPVVAALVAVAMTGCGVPDFEAQFFDVHVRNDVGLDVTLTYCVSKGCAGGETRSLKRGATASLRFSDQNVLTIVRITEGGRVVGCVARMYHAKQRGALIRLSTMTRCPW